MIKFAAATAKTVSHGGEVGTERGPVCRVS